MVEMSLKFTDNEGHWREKTTDPLTVVNYMLQTMLIWTLCLFIVLMFKTGFFYVALADLELTLYIRLAFNSDIHQILSTGIKGVCHHCLVLVQISTLRLTISQ